MTAKISKNKKLKKLNITITNRDTEFICSSKLSIDFGTKEPEVNKLSTFSNQNKFMLVFKHYFIKKRFFLIIFFYKKNLNI